VENALQLVPESRPARLVLVTDGEFSEQATLEAARLAAIRQIPVDVWNIAKPNIRDVSVYDLQAPAEVPVRAPFQFTGWIQCSAPATVTYELRRNGSPLSRATLDLPAGVSPVLLRDVLETEGLHGYELVVNATGEDRVPENNRARSVVRSRHRQKLLLVTRQPQGNIARILQAYSVPHEIVSPQNAAGMLTLENLTGSPGVVLDNVNAESIGSQAMRAIRLFVRHFGGGLYMTGGKDSYGIGGYYKSPVEDCLPVSLEVRKEIRKNRMSLVIAMDRSGSMAVPVPGGLVKMDLANNGAIEAIKMLGPQDRISVIAVDSEAHVIVPLSAVDDPSALIQRTRKIRSEGGGIYIYEALEACYKQLSKADTAVRHVILFADAADSEVPGEYVKLLALMAHHKMTVSVIGLGSEKDTDAALLKDIARLGNGRIFFTDRAEELPRLFSYETILADRSAYIETPMEIKQSPAALSVLANVPAGLPAPALQAYNLGYLKPTGQAAWLTVEKEKEQDPTVLWAFGSAGVGRSTALMFDVDGPDSRALQGWNDFAGLIAATLRWTFDAAVNPDATLELRRDGQELIATLDIAGNVQETMTVAPQLLVASPGTADEPQRLPLHQQPDGTWRGVVPLEQQGFYHAAANLGGAGTVRAAPVVLPYSPEHRHWETPQAMQRIQTFLDLTGGIMRRQFTDVFVPPRTRPVGLDLQPWLLVAMLVGWVLEIAMRRLAFGLNWPVWLLTIKIPKVQHRVRPAPKASPPVPTTTPEPPPVPPPATGTVDAMTKVRQKRRG
jgi:hypothetical protein